MIKIYCDKCLKQDVCKEQANFKFGIYNIQKSNTTVEDKCFVPLEDNDLFSVTVECTKFYPKGGNNLGRSNL